MQDVQEHVNEPPLNLSRLIAGAGFCHDATWTLAYALNRTITGTAGCYVICCVQLVAMDTCTHGSMKQHTNCAVCTIVQ